jgi:hypothetical protein
MLSVLVGIALLLSAADHWTTWRCFMTEAPGWIVTEGNPLAAWLFTRAGVVPGLALDSAVTLAALGFLLVTPRIPRMGKVAFLALLIWTTGLAVANNLEALATLALAPQRLG